MAKFLQSIEKNSKKEIIYKIWTNAGTIIPKITSDGLITVDMGEPILNSKLVPTTLEATIKDIAVDSKISIGGFDYKTTCVSMGNPHAVRDACLLFVINSYCYIQITFVDDLDKMEPSFNIIGPLFEKDIAFPQKVNAEFVQVMIY